jgi:hypothetical protein
MMRSASSPRRTRSGHLINKHECEAKAVDATNPLMVVVKQEMLEEVEEKYSPPVQVKIVSYYCSDFY